jgi:ribonuclease P protein component
VLPSVNRMRRSTDFASVVRRGTRARGSGLVVHQRLGMGTDVPLVGFVVNKAVGGSVVRHRVTRRLRAQLASRLPALPADSGTVVRALPEAADATSAQLGAALDNALGRLQARR